MNRRIKILASEDKNTTSDWQESPFWPETNVVAFPRLPNGHHWSLLVKSSSDYRATEGKTALSLQPKQKKLSPLAVWYVQRKVSTAQVIRLLGLGPLGSCCQLWAVTRIRLQLKRTSNTRWMKYLSYVLLFFDSAVIVWNILVMFCFSVILCPSLCFAFLW